jgi:hypothetical protein
MERFARTKHVLSVLTTLGVAFTAITMNALNRDDRQIAYRNHFWEIAPACIEAAIENKDQIADCKTVTKANLTIHQHYAEPYFHHPSRPGILSQKVAHKDGSALHKLHIRDVHTNGSKALVAYELDTNTEGTNFSSQIVIAVVSAEGILDVWAQLGGGGDRCQDGYTKFEKFLWSVDGRIAGVQYSVAATPFRLLNPTDQTNWRRLIMAHILGKEVDVPATFRGWIPYGDVDNRVESCAGRIVKEANFKAEKTTVVGVEVSSGRLSRLETESKLNACINASLSEIDRLLDPGRRTVHDWQEAVALGTQQCFTDDSDTVASLRSDLPGGHDLSGRSSSS